MADAAAVYNDFDDSDDLADGNDQEIEAELGTILSWDEEDALNPTLHALGIGTSDLTSTLPPFIQYNPLNTTLPSTTATTSIVVDPTAPKGATTAVTQPAPVQAQPQQITPQMIHAAPPAPPSAAQVQYPAQYVTMLQAQMAGTNPAPTVPSPLVQPAQPPKAPAAAPGAPIAAAPADNRSHTVTAAPAPAGQPIALQPIMTSGTTQAPAPAGATPIPYHYQLPGGGTTTMYTIAAPSARPIAVAPTLASAPPGTEYVDAYGRPVVTTTAPAPGPAPAGTTTVLMPPTRYAATPQPILSASPLTAKPPLAARKDAKKAAVVSSSDAISCSDTDGEAGNKKKKKAVPTVAPEDMTPAQRAKANRDRNREHARNTRLRKKAYLEKLKTTVEELCRERDTLVSERAGAANLLVEMHNTRTEVLLSFFALRSTYEKRRELWSSILDESSFSCVIPVTPYRSFPASEVQVSKCQRTVLGIDGMMADTASLHLLLNTLVDRSRYPTGQVQFRYTLVTEDAVVAGNQMMARWVMSTVNASQLGARMEVSKQGMLCCKFNSAHKITGMELMFDVMAFMLQLKQASGSALFSVVPNTVQTCQRSFESPMVMTLADRPYTIVQVNKLWERMTGYSAEEVVGKSSCRILQGQDTSKQEVNNLMSEVRYKRAASASVVNYTRSGSRFRNFMNLYPLSTDSKITHYVALTVHVDSMEGSVVSSIPSTQSVTTTAAAAAAAAAAPVTTTAMAPATATVQPFREGEPPNKQARR